MSPARGRWVFMLGASGGLVAVALLGLSIGAGETGWRAVLGVLTGYDPNDYDHYIVVWQRLPRVLIAIHVGAIMACGGAVLQGLTRNPLASPATLGISAGATLSVVASAHVLGWTGGLLGGAALGGGIAGFVCCLMVARLTGHTRDPRGLALILSGALVSMLFIGLANAFLLADPEQRSDFLGWVAGNINHVYVDRLEDFWGIGVAAVALLLALARPLTLITLGPDKAASAGVNVTLVTRLALGAVMVGTGSAVAICGPLGFVGLAVPHMVRPFAGAGFALLLPACAVVGAMVCVAADLVARHAFSPFILHTGVIMDLLGGVVFAVVAKRFYLASGSAGGAGERAG